MTARKFLIALATLALAACQPSDGTELTEVGFADLPGWQVDQQAEALQVFANSCAAMASRLSAYYTSKTNGQIGSQQGWADACAAIPHYGSATDDEARLFFEQYFTPFHVTTGREPQGLFTGYYEPLLMGSMTPDARFNVPVYGVPGDLVSGEEYFTREQIESGALAGRAPVLLYVDDAVMLFFLHVQGSGKVILPDGSITGIQYAGQNGHQYIGIGALMRDEGYLQEVSLQTIRDFLRANPDLAPGIMNQNPSYIFFKLSPGEEYAKGALGISLTPMRSIAIDDDRAAYGVPTYIATSHPNYFTRTDEPLHRLMVSQDTGGALKGPHRADIFFGRGDEAEWAAGQQNSRGDVYWLLPK